MVFKLMSTIHIPYNIANGVQADVYAPTSGMGDEDTSVMSALKCWRDTVASLLPVFLHIRAMFAFLDSAETIEDALTIIACNARLPGWFSPTCLISYTTQGRRLSRSTHLTSYTM